MGMEYGTGRSWQSSDSSFSSSGTTRNKFWKPSKNFVLDIMGDARDQYRSPLQYFPGATAAATSPHTSYGIDALGGYAREGGGPVVGQSRNLLLSTLRGDYVGGNPYLDAAYQRAAGQMGSEFMTTVLPHLESRFAAAGRTGSAAYGSALGRAQGELASGLGDLGISLYGNAYETERARQMQALGMAPMVTGMELAAMESGIRAGQLQQGEEQRHIDADMARWNFNQMEPWQRMALASGMATLAPVVHGTNWTQAGQSQTSSTGTQVTPFLAPDEPSSTDKWLGIVGSLLNPAASLLGGG